MCSYSCCGVRISLSDLDSGRFGGNTPDVAVQRVHVAGTGGFRGFLKDFIDNGSAPSLTSLLERRLAFPKSRMLPEGFKSVGEQAPITVLKSEGPMGSVVGLQSPVLISKMLDLQSGFWGLPGLECFRSGSRREVGSTAVIHYSRQL